MLIVSTFVIGVPAVSFSRKRGIARGPNRGVDFRHALIRCQSAVVVHTS